ncbi:MAG TPA: hypothetical protein VEB41_02590 [Burkholderiales bacterium]|nr:hypothetical protein [Burkholderiales bacterium]
MPAPWVFAAVIAAGLAVDQQFQPWGQATVNAAVWSLFLGLAFARRGAERLALFACLAYAWAGELVLSDVLRLYAYREGSVPLFVPPGHALLLLVGTCVAASSWQAALRAVPWIAAPLIAWAAWTGADVSAPWLFALYLFCVRFGPSPALYSAMFALSLAMELYGVWLGNWAWAPYLHNPPLAAGAFYCVLDWMVIATRDAWTRNAARA